MAKGNQSTVFEHEFSARVNKEGDHHEVILTSSDSKTPMSFILRNQPGAKSFVDGGMYKVSFVEMSAPTKEERAAQMAGIEEAPSNE